MYRTNICVVPYIQRRMQLQVQQMLNRASCNMQLANSCSHTILNARVNCVNFVNFTPYFLYHYSLHCIVLHALCLHCSLTRQGCCATANFAHATKQLFPWYSYLPCHSPFFSPAIRPCTIEDSAFTYAINCATGSSSAAELLPSALFSLPPCYFGA